VNEAIDFIKWAATIIFIPVVVALWTRLAKNSNKYGNIIAGKDVEIARLNQEAKDVADDRLEDQKRWGKEFRDILIELERLSNHEE